MARITILTRDQMEKVCVCMYVCMYNVCMYVTHSSDHHPHQMEEVCMFMCARDLRFCMFIDHPLADFACFCAFDCSISTSLVFRV